MLDSFTLSVPLDARFRGFVPEVAARYAELVGGTPEEGRAFADDVARTVERLVGAAHEGGRLDLAFSPERGAVRVSVSCGHRIESIHRALAST
jgi:hypothetical protein